MINMFGGKQRKPTIKIARFANKTTAQISLTNIIFSRITTIEGKTKSNRNRRKQTPTFLKKSKIFFQEQVHTESPPLDGGRNLIGGTRIVSKKNIE
jgi:hypothetical protein